MRWRIRCSPRTAAINLDLSTSAGAVTADDSWSAGDAIRPIERKHTSCKGTCADTRYGVQQQPVLELVVDNG